MVVWMMRAFLLTLVTSSSLAWAQALPPGHPPLGAGAQSPRPLTDEQLTAPLPPSHPPVGAGAPKARPLNDTQMGAPLPPSHPPVDPGTPSAPPSAAPSAEELLQRLEGHADLKNKEKTFEVASALGKLYFAHGRYGEAIDYLSQAMTKAEPARAFFLAQRKKAAAGRQALPAPSAVGCEPNEQTTLEQLFARAEEKKKAGDAAGAASCARAALLMTQEVESLLAGAHFLQGNADAALKGYERQLELFPSSPEALYGRSAVLLDSKGDDPKALLAAREGFRKFVEAYPTDARAERAQAFLTRVDEALPAGGVSKLAQARAAAARAKPLPTAAPAMQPGVAPLNPNVVDAIQNTEVTPDMERNFAEMLAEAEEHLAKGRYQDALGQYRNVVPFQPNNGRARAGMAWSLVGLGKPTADRVWTVAVTGDPKAVDALGDTLKAKGDEKGAKALWEKLKASAPSYPGLDAKLKSLR